MEGPFNLLDEFPDTVVVEPRAEAQGSCLHFEPWNGGGFGAGVQADAETVVHDLLYGLAGLPRLGPQPGCDIVVEG